ncbi:hypothetical protein KAR28_01325 [Candidatus Parcubacteria bacterium]|nr:hypothetical protein [Candidatus Parcubacteria bacterium]
MTKIIKATSKGQITLPAIWRKQFNTDQFLLNFKENKVTIEPIEITSKKNKDVSIKEIIRNEKRKGYDIIFDASRDNKGKGIELKKFIKILEDIDG